jgi:DHA1 family bicyclomycin/chloramphenicol resistance-like MFS transporter
MGRLSPGVKPLTPGLVALFLAVLLGLQPVTTDLYLPALPLLARDLAAPMPLVQLTMSALLLAFGLGQLLMGPLSDRLGRRPVLLGGLALYTLSSLGGTLAPDIQILVVARVLQGVGMAAAVACARAMVRDLFEPHEGARIMSLALSGLGVIAILAPSVGGLVAATGGWRAALTVVTLVGLAVGLGVAWRLPETVKALNPHALAPGPLWRAFGRVASHPSSRAWTALISSTYAGLFVLLAGSSFVYMGTLGLSARSYGLSMSVASLCYLGGTWCCRRLLTRNSLAGTVWWGAWFSLAGGLGMLALAVKGEPAFEAVLLTHCLYTFGHGIHQPCGQAGAVAAFPGQAGVASAWSGFVLALTAFLVGLWLGQAMDGRLITLASGLCVGALATSTVAWTLVRRHGDDHVAVTA